ncbi:MULTISPECIES: hypothetical protein [unclassified Helicobacter]|uniref:hypothetical protein n=1 Tax=unclassified Helicobacter TaxID=2593540 RepID=UPI000CF11005|nr:MULTISPECIES: hypothetical protein [unclassified Helicobacter]
MVSNINTQQVENTSALLKDKKTQTQEMVKKEQENFSKLIQEKAKNSLADSEKKAEKKVDSDSSKETLLTQSVASPQPQDTKNLKDIPSSINTSSSSNKPNNKAGENKTLGDVQQLAQENDLNLQDMQLEKEDSQDAPKQNTMGTQNLLEQKKLTSTLKATTISQPLAQALKEISSKDKESRMMQKSSKLEYKLENKTEKIAVIQRGKSLPKNIVDARLRNEKREMAYQDAFNKFGIKDSKENVNVLQEALQTEEKKKSLATS